MGNRTPTVLYVCTDDNCEWGEPESESPQEVLDFHLCPLCDGNVIPQQPDTVIRYQEKSGQRA